MDLAEFQGVRPTPGQPAELSVTDLEDRTPRTLAYGYTCNRDTWHAYLDDPDPATGDATRIHVVIYNGTSTRPRGILHREGPTLPIEQLRPDKRVYPHATDAEFARLMASRNHPLPFTTFDEDRVDRARSWWGHTHATLL